MKKVFLLAGWCCILLFCGQCVTGQSRQMEYLDRGLLAIKTTNAVFVSWRSLGTDGSTVTFNLYRNNQLINESPLSLTNFTDTSGSQADSYVLKVLVDGEEVSGMESQPVTPWAQQYLTIALDQPAGGTTPDDVTYTYLPNDCSVGDLDGDGQYEIVLKWDPTNSKDNSQSGYTGNVFIDAYELDGTKLWRIDLGRNIRAGAHYTQFMVYDLDGDGRAELVCKTAPGTVDGKGNAVIMGSDDSSADYRTSSGTILSGPEYLTLFDGLTGAELNTVAYDPPRHPTKLNPTTSELKAIWGDNYGNRQDRFLACVAYLDGTKPSVVMGRGYYTRSCLAAYDVKDKKLVQRWFYDSGSTSGIGAYGQGNHNLSVGDVDVDGKDEIIYGSCAWDDDGSLLYRTGLGHGDALHLSDLDPDEDGLELWDVHEEKTATYGYEIHNAGTGGVKWGTFSGTDVGRGLAADIDPNHRGFEMWSTASSNVYSCKGEVVSTSRPSVNFRVYWDGDLQDELLDGTKLDKWKTTGGTDRLFTFYNYSNAKEINSTKANPCLSADILGDWREEVVYYNSSNGSELVLFSTVIPTDYKLYTPMHDPVYRMGIAWQNVAYNQPPHLGFYIGDGLTSIPTPSIYTPQYSITTSSKLIKSADTRVYKVNDKIRIESDDEIDAVSVVNMKGQTIFSDCAVKGKTYEFSIAANHSMVVVKWRSKDRVFTNKILNF
ncbi:rhamnogalacturonan lyase [Mangrovibacterium diazotrophicum]|uniref:Rhamnogalacturonan endolyase n=1 Tax=Mangrovibacterium diazotrophicum TaxID=1261403 RepID=A0A419WAW5_9BACT|nr:rhamnogalacturonan lyase [Mangrovibacterium diazotrophicum]RKD92552.1 rhamnogalacturonan endolyase [Mangrovibacterium diazotrophicum]